MPAPPLPEPAMALAGALAGSGYFLPVLGATQTICGLLLLSGFAAPLALVILAPITLQIILFHAFLTPGLQNLVLPLIMVVLHVTAAGAYWRIYRPLFSRG
jgi:putative oxidoreductase